MKHGTWFVTHLVLQDLSDHQVVVQNHSPFHQKRLNQSYNVLVRVIKRLWLISKSAIALKYYQALTKVKMARLNLWMMKQKVQKYWFSLRAKKFQLKYHT